ncbi:ExeM/NucH family extracellular endonuclease [Ralstonia pickettii]|uniref:ExeM/NucH family extracellular endonuclease n=1 Tax=Ralstonia pickettii TaxID=329 RepID=UPI0015FB3F1E|nr:ExeM/NucH family extracellular endonuclease [Ralstonia pickettii]MBB0025348.1 ExeM/NucH family extracellular endonuclease [Ralstonia pickettii]MBB0036136.1 ExeM/NucH family extracellular endonuclease [Ralstonia pickettii]MBB0098676.1 ExeM/NucH family extracellular endonuclease [Ralstonia pickettii]MBB0108265.1 ExeM/NucH family extracellular endonuclease [Ralstonia pickettii]MBB0129450.1 ExeM/NucH family extracellular endonuclease [Ralstonia pickettii]
MRLHFLLAAVLSVALPAQAELLISEYVEGSSNNKAIEIYNPDGAEADLSVYKIEQYNNGASTPTASFALSGKLAPGAVHVMAHSTLASVLGSRVNQTAAFSFNGDDALRLTRSGVVVDRIGQVGYQPPSGFWGTASAGTKDHTLRRQGTVKAGDTDSTAAFNPSLQWDAFNIDDFSDLGLYNGQGTVTPPPAVAMCGAPATHLADVQGAGATSPLVGLNVEIEAVVTADYSGATGFNGFFVQQPDAQRRRLSGVSEGLFVYAPGVSARAGDLVHLVGKVEEKYGQTQLTLATGGIASCASGNRVTPVDVTLPVADAKALSAYEGMLVRLPQTLTVSETYELGRHGSVLLSNGRLPLPTNVAPPAHGAAAQAAANALNRIVLDDGSNQQNPASVRYPAPGLSATNPVRAGYTVSGLQGVLEMRYNAWRLQPVPGAAAPVFNAAANPRAGAPVRHAQADVRVASFNVLNYFNGDGKGAGFDDRTDRGAKTQAEFERQEAKIVAAIGAINADVIGLMEIENDGYGDLSAIRRLTSQLGADWRYVDPGVPKLGGDAITVAIVYNSRTVEPVGAPATLAIDNKNRQPLARSFRRIGDTQNFTVVVNHLKSKGCSGATGKDADQGDGQSCWNPTRVRAAGLIADWLATSPTGVADVGQLLIGDLNSYAKEDPVVLFAQKGYADMVAKFVGRDAYSYVYGGESGYIDHALATPGLAERVRAVHEWHINADEPIALEYAFGHKSAEQQQTFYAPDAYRSSDHDPVLVDLALNTQTAGGGTSPEGDAAAGAATGSTGVGGAGAVDPILGLALAAAAVALARRRACRS